MKHLALLLCILSFSAFATEHRVDLGLGLTFPQAHTDFNNEADTDTAIYLNYRQKTSKHLSFGVGYYRFDFTDTDFKDDVVYLLGRYDFASFKYLRPFATIGAGMANVDPEGSSDYMRFTTYAGAGIDTVIAENLRLGFNFNYHFITKKTTAKSEQTIYIPSLFLTYAFGPKETHSAEATIVDYDKDGIKDSEDHCPNTKMGVRVNAYGCDVMKKDITIALDVKFEAYKTEIDLSSTSQLDKMGRTLVKNPEIFIEIQGHSDTSGDEKKNTELSKQRAQSVKDYLVRKHGITSERLLVRGYGPKFPLKSNETAEGREANRRVQAKIISK